MAERDKAVRIGRHWLGSATYADCNAWLLKSIPESSLRYDQMVRKLNGRGFSLVYDFEKERAYIITNGLSSKLVESAFESFPGVELEHTEMPALGADWTSANTDTFWRFVAFPTERESIVTDPNAGSVGAIRYARKEEESSILADIFSPLTRKRCKLIVSFSPARMQAMRELGQSYEKKLSKIVQQSTGIRSGGSGGTSQQDFQMVVADSDVTKVASEICTMANKCISTNDAVYEVSLIGLGEDAGELKAHLLAKFPNREFPIHYDERLERGIPLPGGELLSGERASRFMFFAPEFAKRMRVVGFEPLPPGDLDSQDGVLLGHEVLKGLKVSGREVRWKLKGSLTAHTVVSGQAGSGKTSLVVKIAKHAAQSGTKVIAFGPSRDLLAIAMENPEMGVIDFKSCDVPMNPVRCPDKVNPYYFARDLCNWLPKALEPGPYLGPLKQALSSILPEIYAEDPAPSISKIIGASEAAIQRRFSAEGKLDKYVSIPTSALEGLRQLAKLNKFSSKHGVKIESLFEHGGVCCTGAIPFEDRPLFYSFVFAQALSYADAVYDEWGNDECRLLLIFDEAQEILRCKSGPWDEPGFARFLESRLPPFRKKGVGLLFSTHFLDRIDENVVRHAQNRFIFKQDAKSTKESCLSLGMSADAKKELAGAVSSKLLELNTRECVCKLLEIQKDGRRTNVTPFMFYVSEEHVEAPTEEDVKKRVQSYLEENGYCEELGEMVNEDNKADYEDERKELFRLVLERKIISESELAQIKLKNDPLKLMNALVREGFVSKKSFMKDGVQVTVFECTDAGTAMSGHLKPKVGEPKVGPPVDPDSVDIAWLKANAGCLAIFEHIGLGYAKPTQLKRVPRFGRDCNRYVALLKERGLIRDWQGSPDNSYYYEVAKLSVYRKTFGREAQSGCPQADGSESFVHIKAVQNFKESLSDCEDGDRFERIPDNETYRALGIKIGDSEFDCVKVKGNEVILYEFETGKNNEDKLLTNLCKLVVRKREEEAKGRVVKAIWESGSRHAQEKIAKAVEKYKRATNEQVHILTGTSEERRSGRLTAL